VFWNGSLSFYSPGMAVAFLVAPLLTAALAAGIGMLVSMRAPTARAAAQSLTVALFILMLPVFAVGILPDSVKNWVQAAVGTLDLTVIPIVLGVSLFVVDCALLWIARTRFTRTRLAV
jgi:hypothetical protein